MGVTVCIGTVVRAGTERRERSLWVLGTGSFWFKVALGVEEEVGGR